MIFQPQDLGPAANMAAIYARQDMSSEARNLEQWWHHRLRPLTIPLNESLSSSSEFRTIFVEICCGDRAD